METDEGLVADWDDNSLLGSRGTALPIGFQPLARVAPPDPQHAMLRFAEGERTWHVIDPGRTVDLTFVQPTRGSGRLSMGVELFTQPLMLEDVASAITVQERVRGEMLPASPESGEGQVSDQPLYPYSAGDVLVIPPGCWTDFGGDPRPSVSPPAARPAAP